MSPRWNGGATLCFAAFLHVAFQIWIQDGAHGASETKIDHFVFQIFFSHLSSASHLSEVSGTGSQPLPPSEHTVTASTDTCVPARLYWSVLLDIENLLASVAFER